MSHSELDTNQGFILLGANLDTGNMGVSALLVSTVKCIRQAFPGVPISLLCGSRGPMKRDVVLGDGQAIRLGCLGVRENKTVWRKNHILRLLWVTVLINALPVKKWRDALFRRDPILGAIVSARGVADITGGDSFSDIYGVKRLFIATLFKALIILTGQKLILLPQTYGPFKSGFAKSLARWVLRRSAKVYSRDEESIAAVAELMGKRRMRAVPRFSYDMAFVLDPVPPKTVRTIPVPLAKKPGGVLVGMNVSGLLYNGGYTKDNMFGLRNDYPALVIDVVRWFLEGTEATVLLVPHVFAGPGDVESDPDACRLVLGRLGPEFPGRLLCLDGIYDQSEIKYLVGQCDFFLGSRMHACIAAISQGVPAVPLAYSRKFSGVFDSVGQGDLVLDLTTVKAAEVAGFIAERFGRRAEIAEALAARMPEVKRSVQSTISDPGFEATRA